MKDFLKIQRFKKKRRFRYRSWRLFDYIQTFYIDPESVNNATSVMITSVDLFFKAKPHRFKNISGFFGPGITIAICEVENEEPNLERVLAESVVDLSYDEVNTSDNATVSTTVSFGSPLKVDSGKFYGLVLKFQDPAFFIWENIQGHRLITITGASEKPSPGSISRFDGRCFRRNNIKLWKPHWRRDIKFKINIAKFNPGETANTTNTHSFVLVNKAYEFFSTNSSSGIFEGGEWVYKSGVSNESGTISISSSNNEISGNGTSFTNNHLGFNILVSNGSVNDVLNIVSVTNTTHLTVDRYPSFSNTSITYKLPPMGKLYHTNYTTNTVVLVDSNASNSSFLFEAGDTISGSRSGATAVISSINRHPVDRFKPRFMIGNPSTANFSIKYAVTTEANSISSTTYDLQLDDANEVPYKGYILSRSQEVVESGLYGSNKKSAYANVTFTITTGGANSFNVPYIETSEIDFASLEHDINSNTLATVNGVVDYDTEVDRNGLAKSKYISIKTTFAENRYAEDVIVYLTAYRPANTNIKVYAKLHNSSDKEAFDDKAWTPLELRTNVERFSSIDGEFVEYSYGLPQYPDIDYELTGSFFAENGNNIITSTVDHSSNVSSGDLIKIGAPLFPENHEVYVVDTANSTTITTTREINNNNIAGEVIIDKLKYRNTAWNNINNDNVARYVTESKVEFDYYNTMQFKIVFLADNTNLIPKIEQFQAIGASA